MCNKLIKFGCFEQEVGHLYDKTATGHYASILEKMEKYGWEPHKIPSRTKRIFWHK